MATPERILVVSHLDVPKRPRHLVRQELWNAAVEHISHEILARGYSGQESVPFMRAEWPKVAYSMLEKSPSFEYSKKEFSALLFSSQQAMVGPTYSFIDLMRAVENKIAMMNYIVKVSGSEGVVV